MELTEGVAEIDTRKGFHEELKELDADVIRLSAMATEAVQAATGALLKYDFTAAQAVVANDEALDELTRSMEERVYLLLARQQPVAVDLRTLVATLRVIHDLERVGDLMVNVAKTARRLYPTELEPKLRSLIYRMCQQATIQLQLAADALAERDPARARALADMDDVMDDLQKELFRTIFGYQEGSEACLHLAVQAALVGRYFERVGDHAVNIGERVVYMVTGIFYDDAWFSPKSAIDSDPTE